MFLFQALSPEMARTSVIQFNNIQSISLNEMVSIGVKVKAVPWQSVEPTVASLQGIDVTAKDIILWTGCTCGILFACSVSICYFVRIASIKDSEIAKAMLRRDKKMLQKVFKNEAI